MDAIITGDIVNSSKEDPSIWLAALKEVLNQFGSSPKDWEIYRGDSFQLRIDSMEALKAAVLIKASIKKIKTLDVRMSIGLGSISHHSTRLTESNGDAFVRSGEHFEDLKRNRLNLIIASEWADFNRDVNLFIKLALLTMDHWTENAAEVVKVTLENPNTGQSELGKIIGIKQNAVSSRLKRAAFDEISEMIEVYRLKLQEKL